MITEEGEGLLAGALIPKPEIAFIEDEVYGGVTFAEVRGSCMYHYIPFPENDLDFTEMYQDAMREALGG